MRKIIFALALALPLAWSLAAFAEEAPPADAKKEEAKKETKDAKKGKKIEKKEEQKKADEKK